MKDLIKKYGIIGVIITITLFLFITGKFDKCSSTHTNDLIDEVELSSIKKHIVDSVLSVQAKRDIFVIDSMNKIRASDRSQYGKQINKEKNKVSGLENERDSLLAEYNKDTTQQSNLCDSLLEKDKKIIQSKNVIINTLVKDTLSLSHSLISANKKYEIEVVNHSRTKDLNYICEQNQQKLIDELNGKQTWWTRNEKWFYFGSGVVSIAGIVYLLKP